MVARFRLRIMNIAAIRIADRKKIAPPMMPPRAAVERPPPPGVEVLVAWVLATGVADAGIWTTTELTLRVSVGFGAPDIVVEVTVLVSVTVFELASVVVIVFVRVKTTGVVK